MNLRIVYITVLTLLLPFIVSAQQTEQEATTGNNEKNVIEEIQEASEGKINIVIPDDILQLIL